MTTTLSAVFIQLLVFIMNEYGAANIPSLLLCSHILWRKNREVWPKCIFIPFSQQNFNICITKYFATFAIRCFTK